MLQPNSCKTFAVAFALISSVACADQIVTSDGSRLVGTIQLWSNNKVTIVTQIAGTLTIDTGSQTHELLEHYFLVPTDEFTPTALELTEEEEGWLCGHRWWSADEIRASRERFAPPEIADLLANLVTHGPQPLRRIGSAEHQAERDGRR